MRNSEAQDEKRGEPVGSPLEVLVEEWLKVETEPELDPARTLNTIGGNQLGVDHAEGGGVCHIKRRIQKVRVVKDIEEVE